jgi:hypothetical protein
VDDAHVRKRLAASSEQRGEDRRNNGSVGLRRRTRKQQNLAATQPTRHELEDVGGRQTGSVSFGFHDVFGKREARLSDVIPLQTLLW